MITRISILPLTPQQITANCDQFIAIASDIPDEYWGIENFLRDLPDKWTLSIAAWSNEIPIGYAFVSRKHESTAHLHHFMVARKHRGMGNGERLLDAVIDRSRRHGCCEVTLKVAASNDRARNFYKGHLFVDVQLDGSLCVMRRSLL